MRIRSILSEVAGVTDVTTDIQRHLVTILYDESRVDILALEDALENNEGTRGVSHINVTADQVRQLQMSAMTIVDVREPLEYSTDHLLDAVLSPWNSNVFRYEYQQILPLPGTILLVCQNGDRSSLAADFAWENYFQGGTGDTADDIVWRYNQVTVYNLVGGMDAWYSEPVEATPAISPILSMLLGD